MFCVDEPGEFRSDPLRQTAAAMRRMPSFGGRVKTGSEPKPAFAIYSLQPGGGAAKSLLISGE
jgi:hypothetical protein